VRLPAGGATRRSFICYHPQAVSWPSPCACPLAVLRAESSSATSPASIVLSCRVRANSTFRGHAIVCPLIALLNVKKSMVVVRSYPAHNLVISNSICTLADDEERTRRFAGWSPMESQARLLQLRVHTTQSGVQQPDHDLAADSTYNLIRREKEKGPKSLSLSNQPLQGPAIRYNVAPQRCVDILRDAKVLIKTGLSKGSTYIYSFLTKIKLKLWQKVIFF